MTLKKPLAAVVLMCGTYAVAAGDAAAQEESEALFSLPPLVDFSAIVDRPLFSPDRRPPPDQNQSASAGTDSVPAGGTEQQIVLAGTATDQSARAVAILHDVSQGIQFRVWVGDKVEGWTVKAIRPRAIVLGTAAQEITVTLDEPAVPAVP
jgi:hypothetical protein